MATQGVQQNTAINPLLVQKQRSQTSALAFRAQITPSKINFQSNGGDVVSFTSNDRNEGIKDHGIIDMIRDYYHALTKEGKGIIVAVKEFVQSIMAYLTNHNPITAEARKYNLKLYTNQKLDPTTREFLSTIASSKINSKPKWDINKPNVWMVTAETSTFMKTGGLGDVAVDLPEAFNKSYNNDGAKMTIVQPLYESDKVVTLKDNADGTYTYTNNNSRKSIQLVDTGVDVKVPVGPKESTTVRVLKGKLGDTEYRFLKNEKYFGGLPDDGQKVSPYPANKSGVGESERFAFFSKAVASYVKELKEKNPDDAPNIIDANDWHAGPLAAQFKYLMQAKASKGQMDQKLADELSQIPIVYTVHNLEYQGWDWKNTSKILNMLYEGYANDIFRTAKCPNMADSGNSMIVRDTYNAGIHGLSLADAVVAVSPNYAKEIASSKFFGYDFVDLLGQRSKAGNLTGIVNGIGSAGIVPDGALAKKVNGTFPEFKEYNKSMTPAEVKEVRAQNKRAFVDLLQKGMMKDRLKLESTDKGVLEGIDLDKLEKTPMLTVVSRLEGQKGPDIIAASIKHALNRPVADGEEKPIVVILGTGAGAEDLNKVKAELTPEESKRVVFFNAFSVDLMHMIQTAGDIFLMPSKFEPCGLGQLQAMAKGNVPVATATGGLADTIKDGKTGFLSSYDPYDLETTTKNYNEALDKALDMYSGNREEFDKISMETLKEDFSWENSGSLAQYMNLFKTGSAKMGEVVSFLGRKFFNNTKAA